MKKYFALALTALLFSGLQSLSAAGVVVPTIDKTGFIVSADWLKANLDKVIVIDARTKAEYDKEHIVGSLQKHWTEISNVKVAQNSPGWSVIFTPEVEAKIFAELGVDDTKPVIFYNDPLEGWGEEFHNLWATRFVGFKNTYALNGGLTAWKKIGGVVNNKPVTAKAVTPAILKSVPSMSVTTDYIADNLGKIKILDTREQAEYDGKKTYGENQTGRIPGSKHIFYKDFYHADSTFKTAEELKTAFTAIGFDPKDIVVSYCTGGIRSAVGVVALWIAGYTKATNYDASFSEWAGTNQKIEK